MAVKGADLPKGQEFYTVEEVARYLRVAKMSVYRMIHSGEMEAFQIGRLYRIPATAFDQWLRETTE